MKTIIQNLGAALTPLAHQERGISQTTVAEAVGCTFQQVQKYERGTNRVSISAGIIMANALGLELADVLAPIQAKFNKGRGA